ncbi:MAG: hypothetical protein ACLGG4_06020 [Gammaproteobacteria bacterium]
MAVMAMLDQASSINNALRAVAAEWKTAALAAVLVVRRNIIGGKKSPCAQRHAETKTPHKAAFGLA